MASSQVISWAEMPDILAAYQVNDGAALPLLAAALIVGELVAGSRLAP